MFLIPGTTLLYTGFVLEIAHKENLNDYRDLRSALQTSYKEGVEEGEKVKAVIIAKKALKNGLAIELMAEITGLRMDEIETLK